MSVESLTKHTNDATKWAPEQCLQDALESLGPEGFDAFKRGKKLMVICLDDTDGGYWLSWLQAGMTLAECLALLEASKHLVLHQMGIAEEPE